MQSKVLSLSFIVLLGSACQDTLLSTPPVSGADGEQGANPGTGTPPCDPGAQSGDHRCPSDGGTPAPDGASSEPVVRTIRIGPQVGAEPFNHQEEGSKRVILDSNEHIVIDRAGLSVNAQPIIWVANSREGTVSKINTRTMRQVARYCTYPGCNADPSRSTVGIGGDVVVANRAWREPFFSGSEASRASAVKIAGDRSRCVDRNGNGVIDTFEGEGPVPPAFQWTAGQASSPDECVIWLTRLHTDAAGNFIGGDGTLPRAAAFDAEIDADGNLSGRVYIGLHNTEEAIRLDAATGAILKRINLQGTRPYGFVMDKFGNLWVRGSEGSLAKVEVRAGDRVTRYTGAKAPPCPYGITADSRGFIYTAGGGCVSRFNPQTEVWDTVSTGGSSGRGLAVDEKFNVWVADTYAGMYHIDASNPSSMVLRGRIPLVSGGGEYYVGAAIDLDGNPWVINMERNTAYRINPTGYAISPIATGNRPYTYSDMTGAQLRIAGSASGIYRHTFSGCGPSTRWLSLDWGLTLPAGGSARIRLRSAASRAALQNASWVDVAQVPPDVTRPVPIQLAAGAAVEYLQVEVLLRSENLETSPALTGLTVQLRCS
ncbi:MAG: hypothetical protein RMK29_20540 [Myxococcales bacterium]|nr:hypothetical protein [Myxococcota bacterium]MDW8284100.1 hypothetical protein [Myxococcales bacterium]